MKQTFFYCWPVLCYSFNKQLFPFEFVVICLLLLILKRQQICLHIAFKYGDSLNSNRLLKKQMRSYCIFSSCNECTKSKRLLVLTEITFIHSFEIFFKLFPFINTHQIFMDFRGIWFYFVADNIIAKLPLVINKSENEKSFFSFSCL